MTKEKCDNLELGVNMAGRSQPQTDPSIWPIATKAINNMAWKVPLWGRMQGQGWLEMLLPNTHKVAAA